MLYSRHLVIEDTICSGWENLGQTLMEKPLLSRQIIEDTCFNGHIFPSCGAKLTSLKNGHFGNLFKTVMENNNRSMQLLADDTSLFSVVHDINTSTIELNSDLKKKSMIGPFNGK